MGIVVAQPRVFQKAFAFLVEIEGFKSHGFNWVDGLSWDNSNVYPPPGVLRLKRGKMVGDTDLLDWFTERPFNRRRIVVKLLNRDGFVQQRIGLEVHEFKTYDLSPLDNNADENVQESVTFSYHRIEELPLTDADKLAVFGYVKSRLERRVEEERGRAQAALSKYQEAIEARVAAEKTEQEMLRACGIAADAFEAMKARSLGEIAAAREECGVIEKAPGGCGR